MLQPIVIGLGGGLGNCLFALPAIKRLALKYQVSLYCQADYPIGKLFARCQYVARTCQAPDPVPTGVHHLAAQYAPRNRPPLRAWLRCGYVHGEKEFLLPEWQIVKRVMCRDETREDVSDWCRVQEQPKLYDYALIPCGKPGLEWARKKWGGFQNLAWRLSGPHHSASVLAVGQQQEVEEAGLGAYWCGPRALEELPEILLQCRVAIATDSGVGHLASSLGIPTVMIYTATSPVKGDPVGDPRITRKIWRGLSCSPCQSTDRWNRCEDWRCAEIPVEEVLGAACGLAQPRILPVLK